jgi:hypothetical protein
MHNISDLKDIEANSFSEIHDQSSLRAVLNDTSFSILSNCMGIITGATHLAASWLRCSAALAAFFGFLIPIVHSQSL